MIDGDGQRRIVLPTGDRSLCKASLGDTCGLCQPFEFAISRLFLSRARRGMIGHQQLEQGLARMQDFVRMGDDFHAGFDRAHARSRKDACAGVHNTQAANAHRRLVLQVAQRGNVDAAHPSRLEDRRAVWHAHGFPIDREVNHPRRCGRTGPIHGRIPTRWASPAHDRAVKHTPLGHCPCSTCASTSARKCFSTD